MLVYDTDDLFCQNVSAQHKHMKSGAQEQRTVYYTSVVKCIYFVAELEHFIVCMCVYNVYIYTRILTHNPYDNSPQIILAFTLKSKVCNYAHVHTQVTFIIPGHIHKCICPCTHNT